MNPSNQENIERDSAGFPYRALAMVLIAAALVCAVIGIFMLVDNGRHQIHVRTNPTTTLVSQSEAAPKDEKSEKQKPAPEGKKKEAVKVDKAAVRVIVLNNTTREGYAGTTSGKLREAGWSNQSVAANCPESSCGSLNTSTVFYRATPQAKAAAESIAKQLSFTTAARPDWLRSYSEDVIVVLAND